MQALVPPHPGTGHGRRALGASIGLTLFVGAPGRGRCLVRRCVPRPHRSSVAESTSTSPRRCSARSTIAGTRDTVDSDDTAVYAARPVVDGCALSHLDPDVPPFPTVLGVLLLPFVLISFNTVLDTLYDRRRDFGGCHLGEFPQALRQHRIALLITVIVAVLVLGIREGSMADIEHNPRQRSRPDLRDHPHHRRRRHVRRRAAAAAESATSLSGLSVEPRAVADLCRRSSDGVPQRLPSEGASSPPVLWSPVACRTVNLVD